ncbi:ABC transporter permease [Paenarthrobacter sp. A20]|uniref:ABC transporter permease n=1 Tax=Paenarthrobacter sp. A20 TaxID=2817891 RepID=UPI0035A8EC3E|nr:peptide/nickel transport system permease protein [Paenarthrobacter sp. A20]
MSNVEVEPVPAPAVEARAARPKRKGGALGVLVEICRQPGGLFGLAVVGALVLVAVLAPWIAPYDPAAQDISNRLQGPSGDHWVGTDQLGRDVFSRLLHGARIALLVSVPTALIALCIGMLIGLAAGYLGGWVDRVCVVLLDTVQAFPAVILALTLIALLGPSMINLIGVLTVAFIPTYARVTRAMVMQVKSSDFVDASTTLGASGPRIVFRHVLPNIVAPLFTIVALDIPVIVGAEAGLSFLGLGVRPPDPSWGVILNEGFARIDSWPWGVIGAGLTLALATLGFTALGDRLRDLFDPRLVGTSKGGR